ncbi:alpha/beta fold hydrolase [Rubrivirga sp. IMCC43871]|uniref:alpha/beta fold hydrolase n=1 Tax=Rubrivirga sp. IMCC43871 TaxID=3391575 RepID=UPI0039902967
MRAPLVLLHGFLGRGADWDAVREHLPVRGDVLAPDLPGHGARADASPDDTTMDAEADRLVAGLDGPADWVGYSLGGRLALHLAVRHPKAVRRLVLVSASPGLRSETERAARRATDASRAASLLRDFPAFVDAWYRMPLFALPEPLRRRLTADRLAHNDPAGLARSLEGMGTGAQPSHWAALDGISAPTLAVAGARDAKFVALAAAMAAAPAIRAATVPESAHLLPAERPAALASLLRTHLD